MSLPHSLAEVASDGRFANGHYLALLASLSRRRASGTLEVRSDERRLWVCLLDGQIAWGDAEGAGPKLVSVLASRSILDRAALQGLANGSPDDDTLMRKVAEASGQERSALEAIRHDLVRARLAAPMGWAPGTWQFTPSAAGGMAGIDPRLLPDFSVPRIGWLAVQRHVSRDRMRADVFDPVAGSLRPGEDLDRALSALPVVEAMAPLPELLRGQITLTRLRESMPDESPELVAILWLLERGGWIVRTNRGEVGAEPPDGDAPSVGATDEGLRAERLLAQHWAGRHDENFYDLLGVRAYASSAAVTRAAGELHGLWTPLARDTQRADDARKVAGSMITAVELARACLSDDARREDYDRQLKARRPPTVADALARLSAPTASGSSRREEHAEPLVATRQRVADGDFRGALSPARAAFERDPEDPAALAELAWVTWNTRDAPESQRLTHQAGDPDTLLAQALAIDPGHPRAREVRDDIARQRSAGEGTRNTLMGWLRGRP